MELSDVMTTAGQSRFFTDEPVTDEQLLALLEVARFAPSGGNRQPVRFVAVRDPAVKRRLRDLYLRGWRPYVERMTGGTIRSDNTSKAVRDADAFAHGLHDVPVLLMACVRIDDLLITDADLDRPSIVGGASVYPLVQNLLLTAREHGLGTTMTTLLCAFEDEIKPLLGIPDGFGLAASIAVGHPARALPTTLRRLPARELLFVERFGTPAAVGGAGPRSRQGGLPEQALD